MPDDAEYYTDRKRAALAMSVASTDPTIRNIHQELASRFDELASDPVSVALDVVAVDGKVEVSTPTGETASLTPRAAGVTADRLLASARKAGTQT